MKEEFRNKTAYCTFTDKGVICKNDKIDIFFPYGSIIKIGNLMGNLSIDGVSKGKNKNFVYAYSRNEKARIQALIYFTKRVKDNFPKEDAIENEIRVQCNLCGNIFCYTLSDLHENEEKKSSLKSKRNIARGGTVCNSHKSAMHADNSESGFTDYSKCPKCHSADIHEITEKEQANQG